MRRFLHFLFLLSALSLVDAAHGQSRPPLTRVQEVVALTNAQAAQALPVELEGTVTFVEPQEESMFVENDGYGVYINFAKDLGLLPGDRVVVSGTTDASFRPEVTASGVRFLAHGQL